MEFDLDIQHGIQGHIEVTDYSKEYGQYYDEDAQGIFSTEKYKYSQSASLNAIIKTTTDSVELMDVLIDEHKQDKETVAFDIKKDGYYVLTHLVLPNQAWLDEQLSSTNSLLFNYSQIYYIRDFNIYKRTINVEYTTSQTYNITVGDEEVASVKEVIERNIEGTTIKKCNVDIFYTGFLQECYINYCREVFNDAMQHCQPNCTPKNKSQNIFARDFLWMTLNVIEYLVGFKQFLEAQRLLEQINYCGGFCKNASKNEQSKCGCGCGCGSH